MEVLEPILLPLRGTGNGNWSLRVVGGRACSLMEGGVATLLKPGGGTTEEGPGVKEGGAPGNKQLNKSKSNMLQYMHVIQHKCS